MASSAELEIGLHRRYVGRYAVEMRYSPPDADADVRVLQDGPVLVAFDLEALRAAALDPAQYGSILTRNLFGDGPVREALDKAITVSEANDVVLRLRLYIGPSAPELHDLRWETLVDPRTNSPLLSRENVLFSRYLSSIDWRPVRLRPRGEIQALVAISNPTDIAQFQPGGHAFAPIDVKGELERSKSALGAIPVTEISSGGATTLDTLVAHLRDGYDILYLVCHGAVVNDDPYVWLESKSGNGQAERVAGSDLITRLYELQKRPSLVVLASCQSAGIDSAAATGEAMVALGPRLAEAGIPAVVAMHGDVTMDTVAAFMPVFFREVERDGLVDRAMAVARGAVRDRPDYWKPLLFMRLRSGRIWYTPGFGGDGGGFERWPAILSSIKNGKCTPILGPGILEPLVGSTREVARRWAETYRFPMAFDDRSDLPQVAQYLAVNQGDAFMRDELGEYLRQEIMRRFGSAIGPVQDGLPLGTLMEQAAAYLQSRDPAEPHRVLAQLPLPIFLTTNVDPLLGKALEDQKKTPHVAVFPWTEELDDIFASGNQDPDYRPDPANPLVYHLLGYLDTPNSVVLTEDDYFDYLIRWTERVDAIPGAVNRRLADSALLFIGFHMDDWDFRVLFRSIMAKQGGGRRSRYSHVAVQIDPEEGNILDPDRARKYLESYFQGASISIFWGSVDDFIHELYHRWIALARSTAPVAAG